MNLPARAALTLVLTIPLFGCTELYELRDRTQIQEREIARLQSALNEWQQGYHDLDESRQGDLSSRDEEIRALNVRINSLLTSQSETERELSEQMATLETSLREAQAQLAQEQATSAALRQRSTQLESNLSTAQQRVGSLENYQQQAEQVMSQVQSAASTAQENEASVREALAQLRSQAQSDLDERDRIITELRNRVLELQSESGGGGGFSDAELSRIADYVEQTMESTSGPSPSISQDDMRGVIVTFRAGDLFESGSTVVNDNAVQSLTALGYALDQLGAVEVNVVGHTDNEPIRNLPFRDNWQLSASRAENVMRALISEGGLSPERCEFGAGGEYHPVASNSTLDGRQTNRRIEIIVTPGHSE